MMFDTMRSYGYTDASIKKAMLEKVCRGYEGHTPLETEVVGEFRVPAPDGWFGGTAYVSFLCSKCGCAVYVREDELEIVHPPLATPLMP